MGILGDRLFNDEKGMACRGSSGSSRMFPEGHFARRAAPGADRAVFGLYQEAADATCILSPFGRHYFCEWRPPIGNPTPVDRAIRQPAGTLLPCISL